MALHIDILDILLGRGVLLLRLVPHLLHGIQRMLRFLAQRDLELQVQ